jgi:hypothetical protein
MKNKIICYSDGSAGIVIINKKYGNLVCIIDQEDIPRVRMLKWGVSYMTKRNKTHYARSTISGKTISIHRLIMSFPNMQIDHIDGNGLNNRKSNLREVTPSQNCLNKKVQSNNLIGLKNIQKRTYKNGKDAYRVRFRIKGKLITVGHCDKLDDAISLRDSYRVKFKQFF